MKKLFITLMIIFFANALFAEITVKLKDISYIDGLKENQVFGYGLIVGLQGTGDSKIPATQSSLQNLLKNLGLEDNDAAKSRNVAAVLITANLPEFANVGDRVDLTVSSIGDAKSIEGGILVQSPLRGADNQVYVVGQGKVGVGEQRRGSQGKQVRTTGYVTLGGIVEKSVNPTFTANNSFALVLKEWDFTVADAVVKQASEEFPDSKPVIEQSGKIRFTLPQNISFAEFISKINEYEVTPKYSARVVINEKDGTIVMGGDVKISEAVVSKDGVTIRIEGSEKTQTAALLKESSTVKDLVDSLNYLGMSTQDMISVLKALKGAGALHAELIIK